ncbi:MAG TPA: protein kinase [Anaeromyxobacteraceae bacterium]|nr:protein kinase [Anaeromyxobacteraceae bacterium]
MALDDVELWELASRAPEPRREEVVARLAADAEQRARVEALLAQPAPPAGASGARYEIIGLVGAGSQADVYQARRVDLDRLCALKVFRNVSDPTFVERVRREAGLMARVLSPHVVPVFDAGDLGDGRFFIEMALCAEPDASGGPGAIALGRSLRALVAEGGPLAPDDAARLLLPIAGALAAAHRAGVVHSDVKPDNVLVLPVSRRAMLGDFGIAAFAAAAERAEGPVGTLPYLAPEQLAGEPPGRACDVYGLGGTLLFALSGRPPHPDRHAGVDVAGGAPAPVPAEVPPSLAGIVVHALATDPRERPGADEVAAALDAYLSRRPTPWEQRRAGRRLALFYQRHRLIVQLGVAALAVAATLGVGLTRTVVEKTGLERTARRLSGQVSALDDDVARLARQKAALDTELARMRDERAALAGSEAREREARLLAEGRSSEADAQLASATSAAREAATRLERTEVTLAQVEARRAEAEARAASLEAALADREAEARAAVERWRGSLDALRSSHDGELGLLRRDLAREREAAAALRDRAGELERERERLALARADAEARLEARVEACRVERDELRRQAAAMKSKAPTTSSTTSPPSSSSSTTSSSASPSPSPSTTSSPTPTPARTPTAAR